MEGGDEESECAFQKARDAILARLGGGRIALKAAEQALQQSSLRFRSPPVSYAKMFQFTGPIPDGLPPETIDNLEVLAATDLSEGESEQLGSHQSDTHEHNLTAENRYSMNDDGGGDCCMSESEADSSTCQSHLKDKDTNPESEIFKSDEETDGDEEFVLRNSSSTPSLRDERAGVQRTSRSTVSGQDLTFKKHKKSVEISGSQDHLHSLDQRELPDTAHEIDLQEIGVIAEDLNPARAMPDVFPAQAKPKSYLESPGSKVYELLASISRSNSPAKSDPGIRSTTARRGNPRGFVSSSLTRKHHGNEQAEEFFKKYFVKQHVNEVPDYKYSQPRSKAPQGALKQARWSFDEAHPAIAATHYLRNNEQNKILEDDRWARAMHKKQEMLTRERQRAKRLCDGLKRYSKYVLEKKRSQKEENDDDQAVCDESKQTGNRSGDRCIDKLDDKALAGGLLSCEVPDREDDWRIGSKNKHVMLPLDDLPGALKTEAASLSDTGDCDSSERSQRKALTWKSCDDPLRCFKELDEEELRLALGAFCVEDYKSFSLEMDRIMERRQATGYEKGDINAGYESDLEREREEQHAVQETAKEENAEDEEKKEAWADQDQWMDVYRKSGQQREAEKGVGEDHDGDIEQVVSTRIAHTGQGESQVLSEGNLEVINSRYIPIISSTLGPGAMGGYRSEGEFSHSVINEWRCSKYCPPKPTEPEPFEFEDRAKERPTTIMEVKTKQDIALEKREEKALRKHEFKANPIPKSTLEPRFERMMVSQDMKRKIQHEESVRTLKGVEEPFSFYERDKAALERKKQRVRDPNRFQRRFKAKEVPKHVTEERYLLLTAETETRKLQARQRAKELFQASKMPSRMESAMSSSHSGSNTRRKKENPVDPKWGARYAAPARLGQMPDFDMMHKDWDEQIDKAHSAARRKSTIPEGFRFCSNDANQTEMKAEQRRQRKAAEALEDEHLPEQRWPFMSTRKKVESQPPPHFGEPDIRISDTRANQLRSMVVRKNRRKGKYATGEERELIEIEAAKRDADRRAKLYVKLQWERAKQQYMRCSNEDTGPILNTEAIQDRQGDEPASKEEEGVNRQDTPQQHIQARHRQVEKEAREIVEDVLLQQGLDVYKYVEEEGN